MRPLYIYLFFVGIMIFAVSCEKVIDLELNEANPNIVVQAELWEGVNDFSVKLNFTSSYFRVEEQEEIKDAIITIQPEGGEPVLLNYAGDGIYEINDFVAEDGKSYTLDINYNEEDYISTVTMPEKAKLDSLSSVFVGGQFGQEGGNLIFLNFKDNPSIDNYYRAFYDLNGEPQRKASDVYIIDDKFTNGSYITIPLFVTVFEVGDTIDVTFASIDAMSYDYLLTLNTIIGNGQPSAAPANPNSNFTNGALGYFAAYNGEKQRIIIE